MERCGIAAALVRHASSGPLEPFRRVHPRRPGMEKGADRHEYKFLYRAEYAEVLDFGHRLELGIAPR